MKAIISVGSNIEPEMNILEGMKMLIETHREIRISDFYWTSPVGGRDQPVYINGLWELGTTLNRRDLEDLLLKIEDRRGRKRIAGDKYASRTLDLDLFLWNKELINPEELLERPFLQKTLLELEPEFTVGEKPLSHIFSENKKEYKKAEHLVSEMKGVLYG